MRKSGLISIMTLAVLLVCVPTDAGPAQRGRSRKRVLIGFKEGTELQTVESRRSFIRSRGGHVQRSYRSFPVVAAELSDRQISSLRADRSVNYIEDNGLLHALDTEMDASWGVKRIGAGEVHATGNNGAGVKVAVIDTGVDLDHPDLIVAGNTTFVSGTSTGDDDEGHGTHCAGIIAALDNDTGVVGVAPEASIYAVKVLDSSGSGYLSDVAAGIDWAIENGMDIISMSLGSNYNYQTLQEACDRANASGIIVVAAAGNDYRRHWRGEWDTVDYPARYDSVIAVGAIDKTDTKAYFSSTGSTLELAAPGVDVYSTDMGGSYAYMSGTSMACPHVAGAAALFLAADPGADVRTALQSTATDLGDSGWDQWYGYGLVNVAEAAGTAPEPPPILTTIEVSPSSVTLYVGEEQQFTVAGTDQYGDPIATGEITWVSGNTAVGMIDENGLFIAAGVGETTITATGDGSVSGTANVAVMEVPILNEIEVSPGNVTLYVGDKQGFIATGTDQYGDPIATGEITWVSGNETVGTIDVGGLFTAVGVGETAITAIGDGGVSGIASVAVIEAPILHEIQVSPGSVMLYIDENQQFTVTGTDQYGDPIATGEISWVSSNAAVGMIDVGGLFTAVGVGETVITATADGGVIATAFVTVQEEPVGPEEFTFTGTVAHHEESRHTVSVSAAGIMYVNLAWSNPGDLRLRIYDPEGTMVAEADSSNWQNREEEIVIDVDPGDWQVAAKSDYSKPSLDYTIEGTVNY